MDEFTLNDDQADEIRQGLAEMLEQGALMATHPIETEEEE